MSRKSIETPPCGALTWPSSEVPVPNGITGTLWRAQIRTASCTSAVSCGNTTASGGWFSIQVSGVAVLLAHRARGHEPVAEMRGEFGGRRASTDSAGRAALIRR